jgi:hypothetical protein
VPRGLLIALAAGVLAGLVASCTLPARDRVRHAGFWFEPVSFESPMLGGPLTAADLDTIAAVARAELALAFQDFRVTLSDRRDARYRVRVAQELLDHRVRGKGWIAGHAYGTRFFGGSGAVSFVYFASGALSYAPPDLPRSALIEAIGRGIGRGAAHEFAHQFLAGYPEPRTDDTGSYEYHAASRPEQYFGPMHWDAVEPLLAKRLGRR